MKRLCALALLLFAAACSAPPKQVAQAPEIDTQRTATRSISSPVVQPIALKADYLKVDKSERLLVAYADGQPIRVYRGIRFGDAPSGHKRFEGDERTPEGLYTIDRRNPQSRFHLSLGISYPNRADRAYAASHGRSPGGDIFIHGQPTGYRGPPLRGDWTDGCIALTNSEIEELWRIVPNGTPIEIQP